MPVVIKEIHVKTVVEKRVVTSQDISPDLYRRLKEDLLEELTASRPTVPMTGTKKER